MKLFEYTTFDEKDNYFKDGKIKINININKIFEKLDKFQTDGSGFIYRGCSEAKYALYNSAQRLYIERDLHHQVPSDKITEHYTIFISSLIDSAKTWNNEVISKLLKASNINPENSIAILSYMQHYGLPTPFIDFSYNPFVALFFAIDNIVYQPSNNEIDNYFSLYYIFEDNPAFNAWRYVFDKNLEDDNIPYEKIDANSMSIIVPTEELYKIINSLNIINQEGLFLYNNHQWHPMERTYKQYITDVKNEVGEEKFKRMRFLNHLCGCFNIHKSLIPLIKEKLSEMGITKDYIYPDIEKFRDEVTFDGIKKILSR